ncbi:MAG: Obg family GTPase CgtA [Candidatus Omnitrophota bacterium]
MSFVDNARITIKAGNGGGGCNSLYRDKYTRYPRRDGGDGGKGGDVVIRANRNLLTLYDFKYRQHFNASGGGNGSSNRKKGLDAQSLIITVPCGTLITDARTNCRLRELVDDREEFIAAYGGSGGKGSVHAKSEEDFPGAQGEERIITLDLKLIADVGLVGFPNSGKSTLISKISNAHPEIANYPFTTKRPALGTVTIGESLYFSIADIPGLIKGSHLGKGLGDRFLRHIERTKVIIHMIDMAGADGRSPADDYSVINDELKFYSHEVFKKPRILAANKMDLPQAEKNLADFKKKFRKKIIPISALESQGLKVLLNAIQKELFPGRR